MKRLGRRFACLLALSLLFAPARCFSRASSDIPSPGPAFTTDPELARGFHELYAQNFSEARTVFTSWESSHPEDPFGQVAVAAS
jgi:hypothetical protein